MRALNTELGYLGAVDKVKSSAVAASFWVSESVQQQHGLCPFFGLWRVVHQSSLFLEFVVIPVYSIMTETFAQTEAIASTDPPATDPAPTSVEVGRQEAPKEAEEEISVRGEEQKELR